MKTRLEHVTAYTLLLGAVDVALNPLVGREISLTYLNQINCIHCGRVTRNSFGQGYCYPCFISVPQTEECVLHPEKCRAHEGIARDMDYAREHCLKDHFVYLAVTSDLKVGVTRESQIPTRWLDQGASRAVVLARTPNRYLAGCVEVALKAHLADKTNWRRMLTREPAPEINLAAEKGRAAELLPAELQAYVTPDDGVLEIRYPVLDYPAKLKSVNFDRAGSLAGRLAGVKGQYLLFDDGQVFNIRRHNGYLVALDT
ncbi:MAG: DUF2797 domain-containing protein [Acidobacteria bacterium]|nr:DUF2797 domain-containing protein [Acidobacteriota bacterium]